MERYYNSKNNYKDEKHMAQEGKVNLHRIKVEL